MPLPPAVSDPYSRPLVAPREDPTVALANLASFQRSRELGFAREDRYNLARYAAENQQYGQERGIQAQYDLSGLREQAQLEQQQLVHQQRMEADTARQEKQLELNGQEWRYSDDDQRAIDKIESRKSRIRKEGLDPADEESAIAMADQEIAKFQQGPHPKKIPLPQGVLPGGTYPGDKFGLDPNDLYHIGPAPEYKITLVDTGKTQQQNHEAEMAKIEADREKNVSAMLEKRRESAKDEGEDRWKEALDIWEYERDIDRDEDDQAAWLKNNLRPRRSDFLETSFKEEFAEELAAKATEKQVRLEAEVHARFVEEELQRETQEASFTEEMQQKKAGIDKAIGKSPLGKMIRGSRTNPITPTTQVELDSIKKNGGYVRNPKTGEVIYYPSPNTEKTTAVSKPRRRQKIEAPVRQIPKV